MCVGFTVNLVLPVEEQLNNNRIVSIIKTVGKLGHIYIYIYSRQHEVRNSDDHAAKNSTQTKIRYIRTINSNMTSSWTYVSG